MSNLSLFDPSRLPAYLKEIVLDDTTKNLMGSGAGVPRISIKGNVFRKIVGGEEVMKSEDRAMNIIVIRSAPAVYRTFYAGTYKEGDNLPPDCWSSDGDKPDDNVDEPQSSKCATCAQNIAGSGDNDTRACRFQRRIAVVLDNDIEGDIMQVALPAQSIFGKGDKGKLPLEAYVKFIAGFNLPVTAVVTEMRFDTDSATPKMIFKPVRPLTEDEYRRCVERGAEKAAEDAILMSFTSGAGNAKSSGADDESVAVAQAAAAAHAAKQPEAPAEAAKPTRARKPSAAKSATAAPADDEVEGTVRGEPAANPTVQSLLDQWGSDD